MTLLLATDLRVAAENAQFGLSEVKRGILPGNGGTQRTLRQLPYPVAMWLLLSGERLTAQEAYQYGLVNKVVPLSGLMDEAERMADVVCKNGPLAVRAIKELAVRSQYLPLDHGLPAGRGHPTGTHDHRGRQGRPSAFAEKRPAEFKGR